MKGDWQLAYQIHYVIFGFAFLLLTAWCLRRMTRRPAVCKSFICYAINGALVVLNLSQAVIFLLCLLQYVNQEIGPRPLAFENFLFKLAFPCLLVVYARVLYPHVIHLGGRAGIVFKLLLLQCLLFLISDVAELKLRYVSRALFYINTVSCLASFIYGIYTLLADWWRRRVHKDHGFETINNDTKRPMLITEISGEVDEEADFPQSGKTIEKIPNKERIFLFAISCVGVAFVATRMYIIMTGNLAASGEGIPMESWHSWTYVNLFRAVQLGNAAITSELIQRATFKLNF